MYGSAYSLLSPLKKGSGYIDIMRQWLIWNCVFLLLHLVLVDCQPGDYRPFKYSSEDCVGMCGLTYFNTSCLTRFSIIPYFLTGQLVYTGNEPTITVLDLQHLT